MAFLCLAFVAAAAACIVGRMAVFVARLSAALGGSALILFGSLLACIAACSVAALLGAELSARFDAQVRAALVAALLLLVALDFVLLRAPRAPVEPTRSFGAILLVLTSLQLFSAASLAVLAVSLVSGQFWPVAVGGISGAGGVLAFAWERGEAFEACLPIAKIRWAIIAALSAAALLVGLAGQGVIR